MCAVKDYTHRLFIRNVSTYPVRLRVTTWVCRHEVPNEGEVPYDGTFTGLTSGGLNGDFLSTPLGGTGISNASVDFTFFDNPLWVWHFKAVKTKKYMLMPWKTAVESLIICKRKPGWIWFGNNANPNSFLCTQRTGGFSTCVKSIQLVGDLANDNTAFPNPVVTNAPVVVTIQDQITFQCASAGPQAANWGDQNEAGRGGATNLITGQPWNYMYPGPSSSSQEGYSSVVGAITSGL